MDNCKICGKQYNQSDSENFLNTMGNYDYPPMLMELCPTCLVKVYLETLNANKKDNDTFGSGKINKPKVTSPFQNLDTNTATNSSPTQPIPALTPFTRTLAVIFSVISLVILCYSLLLKYFPQVKLPDFPFYAYIVAFSFLTFFIRFSKGSGTIFLFIIIGNFITPQFRNLFYSYFESTWSKIVFTILFVSSFVSLTNLFFTYFLNRYLPKWGEITQNQLGVAALKSYFPTFILYFAVMSPFYLGAIKPGGDPSVKIAKVQVDPIFDSLTNLTIETADVEIARQYFSDGKEAADLGTIEGLNHSVQFYQMAIELVPKFSTAYAEIAYSYGSIYRIKKSIDKNDPEAKVYLNKARVSIDAAKAQNPKNYTSYAVESIIDVITGNEKEAKSSLEEALKLAETSGSNERLLQAIAFNEKANIKSINYLITIKDKINPNSAELFNLLAVKYYKIGNPEKTKEMAERALLLSPKYDEPYFNLALVAKKNKEKISIYDKIVGMKSDYASKAEHFKKLINWQFALKIIFWALFIFFFSRLSYLGLQVQQKKINPEKVGFMLIRNFVLFTVLFGGFELYIHYVQPVNSLTHLFPVNFPIF